MKSNENTIEISDRDRKLISIISALDDQTVYGLECFLVGISIGAENGKNSSCENSRADGLKRPIKRRK